MQLPYALVVAAELKIPLVDRKVGAYRWGLPNVLVQPGSPLFPHLFRGRDPETALLFVDDFDDGRPVAVADPARKH